MQNLVDKRLSTWDGAPSQAEASAALTERAQFILRHRLPVGQTFTGSAVEQKVGQPDILLAACQALLQRVNSATAP